MKQLPYLEVPPQVDSQIDDCVAFIARQPWGRPRDRLRDILRAIQEILNSPLGSPVKIRRPATGNELRRYNAAQFVIVYVYTKPDEIWPSHQVKSVFARFVTAVCRMYSWV